MPNTISRKSGSLTLCGIPKKAPATHLGGAAEDFNHVTIAGRFCKIGSRGGAPAEPGRRWEANYKLKLGQAIGRPVPLGAAGGRELRRGENKECLAVFGSMMTGALVPIRGFLEYWSRLPSYLQEQTLLKMLWRLGIFTCSAVSAVAGLPLPWAPNT